MHDGNGAANLTHGCGMNPDTRPARAGNLLAVIAKSSLAEEHIMSGLGHHQRQQAPPRGVKDQVICSLDLFQSVSPRLIRQNLQSICALTDVAPF